MVLIWLAPAAFYNWWPLWCQHDQPIIMQLLCVPGLYGTLTSTPTLKPLAVQVVQLDPCILNVKPYMSQCLLALFNSAVLLSGLPILRVIVYLFLVVLCLCFCVIGMDKKGPLELSPPEAGFGRCLGAGGALEPPSDSRFSDWQCPLQGPPALML